MTLDNLELLTKNPSGYFIKAFNIRGVKLDLFNSYRNLLNQSIQKKATNKLFIETIRPFLTFYKGLPDYAKKTSGMSKPTIALRNAIALAKDPEESFFNEFPLAMGYDINTLVKNPKKLKAFIDELQQSLKEIRNCYDALVQRTEEFLVEEIIGQKIHFPEYRTFLQERYRNLKKYLLLPHQKVIFQRLYSEISDRNAWLGSIAHACIGKSLDIIDDTDEQILHDKLRDIFHELDNLVDMSQTELDLDIEIAFQFEITSFVEGLKRNLVRLPKSKNKELIQLQGIVKAKLSGDKQLNIATLVKLLEEILKNEG